MKNKIFLTFVILIGLTTISINRTFAANTILSPLDFGTIVVMNNDSIGQVTIEIDGDIIISGPISVLTPGQPAQIRFSNLTAYTLLNISSNIVTATTTIPSGTSEQFTLTNIDTPTTVTTDQLGTAIVEVGGTIQTSGVGIGAGEYLDTTYSASFEVIINF